MRITVCGAAGEVTGSAYLVETDRARVLLDCGMFQGQGATDEKNRDLGPIDPAQLTSVVVGHHLGDNPARPVHPWRCRESFHECSTRCPELPAAASRPDSIVQ